MVGLVGKRSGAKRLSPQTSGASKRVTRHAAFRVVVRRPVGPVAGEASGAVEGGRSTRGPGLWLDIVAAVPGVCRLRAPNRLVARAFLVDAKAEQISLVASADPLASRASTRGASRLQHRAALAPVRAAMVRPAGPGCSCAGRRGRRPASRESTWRPGSGTTPEPAPPPQAGNVPDRVHTSVDDIHRSGILTHRPAHPDTALTTELPPPPSDFGA